MSYEVIMWFRDRSEEGKKIEELGSKIYGNGYKFGIERYVRVETMEEAKRVRQLMKKRFPRKKVIIEDVGDIKNDEDVFRYIL